MKGFLVPALLFLAASSVFAVGPETMVSSHALSGYDYKDVAVVVVVSPADAGRMWLNAGYGYPLQLSEADKLLNLVQAAAKKIDIAISNKSTISYKQEVGRFHTETAALVTVSFETHGFGVSYAVVQVTSDENHVTLLLDRKDTQDFTNVLGNAHSLVDDYQRQVALFK